MEQPTDATTSTDHPFPADPVEPRAACHALVDTFPDASLEHLRALLHLLQRFVTSGMALALFLM